MHTPPAAESDPSDATRALMAREQVLAQRAMLSQSVRPRYLMMAAGSVVAIVLSIEGMLLAPLWSVLLVPALAAFVNFLLDRRARARGEAAAWQFWLVVAMDALAIAGSTLLLGADGYLCAMFFLAAVSGYALASIPAARVQLAIACVLYPVARVLGHRLATGRPLDTAALVVETLMLGAFGWLGMRAPAKHARRVRRARRALADLAHGAFDVRLPTRASDDLGFLAASFNRTAETLGNTVASLRAEIAERRRAESALLRVMEELRGSREALAHQAHHDPLTGLANRTRLRERLQQALASEHAMRVAVLALDLDGFKHVNDSLGHAAGDAVLVEAAARLLDATRGGDTVARLGGDEFAVVLENAHTDRDAAVVAERVLAALRAPFVLGERLVFVGCSVGIVHAAHARDRTEDIAHGGDVADVEAVLRDADTAMYHAKARGKGQYAVFEPHMHAAALERLVLEIDLRAAIERNELTVAYQPIVGLAEGEVEGVEALVRWMHPTRGPIAPLEFIPLAEATGLILPVGRAVLRMACRQGAAWQAARGEPLTVTVNVSGRQLEDPSFVDDVASAIAESGLDARALMIELTESTIAQQPELACERLGALRALGVRIAVDDFGTGYSSLAYLQQFPIDVLKIDKSFVDNVTRGGAHAALARTIVALADALSVKCVAEGVEEAEQRVCLTELGCLFGQGYHFARPMSAEAIGDLLGIGEALVAH